jgi:hypothetical protein
MIYEKCNIWDKRYICIPTNGTLDKKNKLVMGAGLALQAKTLHPILPFIWGEIIKEYGINVYGTWVSPHYMIMFPTKYHWKENSDIELIEKSAKYLSKMDFDDKVYLPKVGCGLGGLNWYDVEKVLSPILYDRFVVCI